MTVKEVDITKQITRNRISEIVGNTIFSNFDTLLYYGRGIDYITRHYNIQLVLDSTS